jgi:ankyrin repeat protein
MTITQKEANKQLVQAARYGDNKRVQAALDAGAAIDAMDDHGSTALICAAVNGRTETCQLLLDNGANIHAANDSGSTALVRAANYNYIATCQLLLEKGADINVVPKDGYTALMWSAYLGETKTSQFLLRQGAAVPTILPKENQNLAEKISGYLTEMKAFAQKAFPTGNKPARAVCITPEGKPTDALLDACATGQFAALIAAPLLHTKNPDDRKLFLDIYKALPKHWQNEEAALYLQVRRDMQPARTPSPIGRGRG